MAKPKRGKSGSANTDSSRWEIELVQAPFNTEDWKSMVVLLEPCQVSDQQIVSLLSATVQIGQRKLFSVVDYNLLLDEVREIVAQPKGGKGKTGVGGKSPQFIEICNQVKNTLDQGKVLSPSLLAKLIKFKLLSIKSKDLDRRENERKLLNESKHKTDSRAQSKAQSAASPRGKSQSPGKGGKKGKKEEKALSPKKDTKLKKRGEESDDFKTIDDEPDGVNDPKHYIIISGFSDPSLLTFLHDMKVYVNVIIKLTTEYHMRLLKNNVDDEEEVTENVDQSTNSILNNNLLQQQLDLFWKDSEDIVKNVPSGHVLRNVAKFDVFVEEGSLPETVLEDLNPEKKTEFGEWLFEKVADVCYDMLEYEEQYQRYLAHMKVIDVSYHNENENGSVEANGHTGSASNISQRGSDYHQSSAHQPISDLRYYSKLLSDVPIESQSVPLIFDCLLEQVVGLTDGQNPMDALPDAPDAALVEQYLDKRLAFFGIGDKNCVWSSFDDGLKSPQVLYHGDKTNSRLISMPKSVMSNVQEVEKKMQDYHPFSNFAKYLCPLPEDWIENYVRRQQLYNFCNKNTFLSKGKFEHAMRQYIFESLPLEAVIDYRANTDHKMVGEQLERIASRWDVPYCDLRNSHSAFKVDGTESQDSTEPILLRVLDKFCWLERFEPSILLQVLDEGIEMRPSIDTYYNRGNNTLLVVLHNPSNKDLRNNSKWDAWLHSDVGLRNYLEHVAVQIKAWTEEQEVLEAELSCKSVPQEVVPSSPAPPPLKDRSRWGLKTRAELEESKNELKESEKGKKGARSRSGTPRTPQKSKSDKKKLESKSARGVSAKKSRIGTGNKIVGSAKSNVSFQDEVMFKKEENPESFAFVGYNLGDNMLCVSGDQSYLFPRNNYLIKIQRTSYSQANTSVQICLLKSGDFFSVNFVNPVEHSETANQELVKSETEPSSNDNDNLIPCIKTSNHGKQEDSPKPASIEVDSPEAEEKLPQLPDIPKSICSYSNVNATFADGMILSLSTSLQSVEYKDKRNLKNTPSAISKEHSDGSVSQTVPPRSPKGKRTKKDEELKVQEDAEKQQKEAEFARKLIGRKEEIIKILKEQEALKNLYVTTPDGFHFTFQHELTVDALADVKNHEKALLLKIYKYSNHIEVDSLENRNIVKEMYRCISDDGCVIKYLSDDTVQILTPQGDIYHSSAYKCQPSDVPVTPTAILDDSFVAGRSSSKKSSKSPKASIEETVPVSPVLVVPEISKETLHIDWHVVLANGQRKIIRADGSEEMLEELLTSQADCYDTKQVLQMREDGVLTVKKPGGTTIVEYMDGTRITTQIKQVYSNTVCNDETGEEETPVCRTQQVIKIENDSMAAILVDKGQQSVNVLFGNGKRVTGFKFGGYVVSKNEVIEMVIDKFGFTSIHPKHSVNVSSGCIELPSQELMPSLNTCLVKQTLKECVNLCDNEGNRFLIDASGNFNIDKTKEEHFEETIKARYFVVHADGSGEELLQYEDIGDYLSEAQQKSSEAVLQSTVEGNSDATSFTVIRPFKGPVSSLWRRKKDEENIIPISLRERDFKTFPQNEDKQFPASLGTRMVISSSMIEAVQPPICPDVLELRHFIQFQELTSSVRQQIIDGINEYGEFVHQQQEMHENLLPKDMRDEEERIRSEQLLQQANIPKVNEANSSNNGQQDLADQYMEAIKPPSPIPPSKAHPERSDTEWENDKLELAELKYAKSEIKTRDFPAYFDTEEGQTFLYKNSASPDMKRLTNELAYDSIHPTESVQSTSSDESAYRHTSTTVLETTPIGHSTPHLDDTSMLNMSSSISMKYDVSNVTLSPHISSFDGRPLNPTPKGASNNNTKSFVDDAGIYDDTKLETIPEISGVVLLPSENVYKSLVYDVSGSLRRSEVERPSSILGSKPNAITNEKFSSIEEPVRRKIKTSSVSGAVDQSIMSKLCGFVLLPDFVDFGILREGLTYAYSVTMKNVGIDSCRFKIKQPPPSTGMKVIYKPGPVAAGMTTTFDIEIFALAVGVEGSSGIGQVSHYLEINTETEILHLPIIATIITQEECDNPSDVTPSGGPSKGTLQLGHRPSSRESLTRPKKTI